MNKQTKTNAKTKASVNTVNTVAPTLNHKAAAQKRLDAKQIKLPKTLENIALEVSQAVTASLSMEKQMQSLSSKLGELVAKAGANRSMTAERVEPFTALCRDLCVAGGMKPDSLKVYLSNVRGVLRAMIAGYKPKAGETLRNMYMQRPSARKHEKTGAQTVGTKKHVPTSEHGTEKMTRKDAVIKLFGHYDDQLDAALMWAVQNESAFIRYVTAYTAAAQADAKEAKETEPA